MLELKVQQYVVHNTVDECWHCRSYKRGGNAQYGKKQIHLLLSSANPTISGTQERVTLSIK